MFGPFYLRRDQELIERAKNGKLAEAKAEYAAELLADLLNRAGALNATWEVCELLKGGGSGEFSPINEEMVARNLHSAIEVFLGDVMEARIRGRRARLFTGVGIFHEAVGTGSAANKKSLEHIGGALVAE